MTPGGGVTDVQARIATIQARIGQLSPSPAATSFDLAIAPISGGGTGTASPTPVALPATSAAAAPLSSLTGPTGPRQAPSATSSAPASQAAARLQQVLPEAGKRWAGPIADAAAKHGLDAGLLAALVRHESNFDPAVRSHAGAIGLGQLMPGTAAGLGVDPHDPLENLDGAARYLKQQLDRFGSADLALAAYNAGPTRVAQAGGVPNITETRTYVDRVLTTWEQYR